MLDKFAKFLIIPSFALLVACGEDSSNKPNAPTPSLADGKADGTSVIMRGELSFGEEGAQQNPIPTPLRFDAYELQIAKGGIATFEITQKGTSRGFDSLLYVYGPRDESGKYADEPLTRDDDGGWGPLSRIRDFEAVEGGTYMLVVGSYQGKGQYRVQAACENDACKPVVATTGECVFGSSYGDLVRGLAPASTITYRARYTQATQLDSTQKTQLVESVRYAGFDQVQTAEEAFATIDASELNILDVWDVSNNRGFEVFEYALGDTSVGTVYAAGTTDRAAVISDLDFYDCVAFSGPARQDCATNSDCADGLRCEGLTNGVGACIFAGPLPEGSESECTTTIDCSEGLVCAGENSGGGSCTPAWMRRHFYVEPNVAISGDGLSINLDSYGLATAHTDVDLDLFVTHDDFSSLRIVLVNPAGTESVIHDRTGSVTELYLKGRALSGFPGDESANGTWTLRIENLNPASSGQLYHFGLEITSRWD